MVGLAALAMLVAGPSFAGSGAASGDQSTVGPDGHKHDTVTITCSASTSQTCYFNIILARGGMRAVRLRGQDETFLSDMETGRDLYIVTVDTPAPTSISICRASEFETPPCRWGYLQKSIDNYTTSLSRGN